MALRDASSAAIASSAVMVGLDLGGPSGAGDGGVWSIVGLGFDSLWSVHVHPFLFDVIHFLNQLFQLYYLPRLLLMLLSKSGNMIPSPRHRSAVDLALHSHNPSPASRTTH